MARIRRSANPRQRARHRDGERFAVRSEIPARPVPAPAQARKDELTRRELEALAGALLRSGTASTDDNDDTEE